MGCDIGKGLHLKDELNRAGYICDEPFAAAVETSLNTRPVAGAILSGPIGTGKTYLPEILSGLLDAPRFFYQCFPGTREDDLLVKMLPSETTVSGIALHDGVIIQAIDATRREAAGGRVVLVLDEWDKTRPSADAFLLDFLQTGRIHFADRIYTADLAKLIVFLTVNIERELSEPLVRRLPKIEIRHLPPSFVYRALQLTHADHAYLFNAVVLYERCLLADLPKPATTQELRQLLDAITTLGDRADWDALVFQFVTKSEEAHELLRRAEDQPVQWRERARVRLDATAYDVRRKMFAPEGDGGPDLGMPRLAEVRGFDDMIDAAPDAPDLEDATGVIELTQRSYNEVVRLAEAPTQSSGRLGQWADITGDRLIRLKRKILLQDVDRLKGLWGENGEVLIREPLAAWEDVKALQEWAPILIVKFSQAEILAKMEGIDLRWTPGSGAEIIVHLGRRALAQCRCSREKEAVVVILDTSGSCLEQARFYSRIATAAVASGDVELYDAPNGGIRAARTRHGWQSVEETDWRFQRRTIIFFGDFDGGDAVIGASLSNKVYWFSSETRYPDIRQHPWCSLSMKAFKGYYFSCISEDDFIPLLRRVR